MTQGIYAITHKPSGRRYIGQSRDIEARFCGHKAASKDETARTGFSFYELLYRYPADFELTFLEVIEDAGELHTREQYWIELLDSTNSGKGFNRHYEDPASSMNCLPIGVREGITQAILAKDLSVPDFESQAFGRAGRNKISNYLNGKRRILPPDLVKILDFLGLELTVKPKPDAEALGIELNVQFRVPDGSIEE